MAHLKLGDSYVRVHVEPVGQRFGTCAHATIDGVKYEGEVCPFGHWQAAFDQLLMVVRRAHPMVELVESPVEKFERLVHERIAAGRTMPEAVHVIANRERELWLEVLEIIGAWPSSEPILREAQRGFFT